MTEHTRDNSPRSAEESAAVTSYLQKEGGPWVSMPPDYTNFSRAELTRKNEEVRKAILLNTNSDSSDVEAAYEKTQVFIDGSFDFFEGRKGLGRKLGRAFVVPMSSDRKDLIYASQSVPLFPLYDPVRFGVESEIRMRAMYGLPPTVLDTYLKSDDDNETGALVLCPMYSDMISDIRPDKNNMAQKIRLLEVGAAVLEKTAQFVHLKLGVDVAGLGATLPKVTHFGNALRSIDGMENLVTTTGHGGTVHTIVETARKVMEETSVETHGKIGVIGGAGSIGWSSTIATAEMIGDHHIISHDIDNRKLYGMIGENGMGDKVSVASHAADVLRGTNIIIVATTSTIDLDDKAYEGLDLTGKVIIDDSQPGCFDKKQVEDRGGKLIWVVTEDGSENKFLTRDGLYTDGKPYNYGENAGIYGPNSEWACGAEAAVIGKSRELQHAIAGPVTPDNVRIIGAMFKAANINVAPFQSFGHAVDIR